MLMNFSKMLVRTMEPFTTYTGLPIKTFLEASKRAWYGLILSANGTGKGSTVVIKISASCTKNRKQVSDILTLCRLVLRRNVS